MLRKLQLILMIFCLGIFVFPKQNFNVQLAQSSCCEAQKSDSDCCEKGEKKSDSCHHDSKKEKRLQRQLHDLQNLQFWIRFFCCSEQFRQQTENLGFRNQQLFFLLFTIAFSKVFQHLATA